MITLDDIDNAITAGVAGSDRMAQQQIERDSIHPETVFAMGLMEFINSLLHADVAVRLIDVSYQFEEYCRRRGRPS
jgi:hypothetical protein